MTDASTPTTSQYLGNAHEADLTTTTLPGEGGGEVTTGRHVFGTVSDAEVGVWTIEEGTVHGTTKDEIFVVLSGRATVEFDDTHEVLEIGPGDVVRLHAGQSNTWTTHERIRKVFTNLPPAA